MHKEQTTGGAQSKSGVSFSHVFAFAGSSASSFEAFELHFICKITHTPRCAPRFMDPFEFMHEHLHLNLHLQA